MEPTKKFILDVVKPAAIETVSELLTLATLSFSRNV